MRSLRIYIYAFLFVFAYTAYSQILTDTTKVLELEEVVILADRIVHKGDYDVLYLSDDNRN